jgi:hypothetical protein
MNNRPLSLSLLLVIVTTATLHAQPASQIVEQNALGPYLYETKPDHEAFQSFNPRKAPPVGDLLL